MFEIWNLGSELVEDQGIVTFKFERVDFSNQEFEAVVIDMVA